MRWTLVPCVALLVLGTAPGCRTTGKSLVDLGPDIETARATVVGSVYAADGTTPLAGRTVECVRVDGGQTVTAITNVTGGYTIQLPPGQWRFTVKTNAGERVVRSPGVKDLGNSELETGEDFVVDAGS
jgi:hypothetical protein